MKALSNLGYVIAALIWLAILALTSNGASCTDTPSCGRWDIFLSQIIGVGFIAPAWLATHLLSILIPQLADKST